MYSPYRMVDTVVEQSIEQYLFQPGPTTTQVTLKALYCLEINIVGIFGSYLRRLIT